MKFCTNYPPGAADHMNIPATVLVQGKTAVYPNPKNADALEYACDRCAKFWGTRGVPLLPALDIRAMLFGEEE